MRRMTPIRAILSLTPTQKRLVFYALDALLAVIALGVSVAVHSSSLPAAETALRYLGLLGMFALAAVLWSGVLGVARLRLKDFGGAAVGRIAIHAAFLAATSPFLTAFGSVSVEPGLHVVLGLTFFALSCLARLGLLKLLISIYRRSGAVTRVLIYGAGRTGMALASALRDQPDLMPVAFLDDNATLSGQIVAGLPVYPGIRLEEAAREFKATRVVLAMPSVGEHRQTLIAHRIQRLGLEVLSLPSFAQLIGDESLVDRLMPSRPQFLLRRELMARAGIDGNAYRGGNVLVSGAGGTIGLELCRQVLAQRPARLVLLEISEPALYRAERELRMLNDHGRTQIVPVLGSIGDEDLVRDVLARHRIGVILHAAAYKHVPIVEANPRAGLINNTLGTSVFANCAREAGVERFVLISSDKAVRPTGVMGASKRLAELVVQDLATRSTGTRFSIVRFGNVLGSSGSVLPLFQEQIAMGGPVTITDPRVTRYFMTVREAVQLVLVAGSIAKGGEVFVLDMGQPIPIIDLARRLIEGAGLKVRDENTPDGDIEIVVTGLRPGEKLHEELTISDQIEPTVHPKIMVVREAHLSELETAAALRDIRHAISEGDAERMAARALHWARDRWSVAQTSVMQHGRDIENVQN